MDNDAILRHAVDLVQRKIAPQMDEALGALRDLLVGTEVTIIAKHDKYRGRAAIIDGVMWWEGEFVFLCYVLRSGSTEYLNTDTASRRYRPIGEFYVHDQGDEDVNLG